MQPRVEIRPPKSPEEFRYIEHIQRDAWGAGDIDITPTHVCVAASLAGGCVYLAFVDGKPVGFVLGILGIHEGKIFLHSHQLGVLREYQNLGIGYMLKLKQREYALSRGLDLIKWTFDPLQSKNAYFNFNKLGIICREYFVNLYGEIRDELNRGLPSDRLYVEWHIRSSRVTERLRGLRPPVADKLSETPISNRVKRRDNVLVFEDYDILREKFVLVEIPTNYVEMKLRFPKEALRWRLGLRQIFTRYLDLGYIIVDVLTDSTKKRLFYVLTTYSADRILNTEWWRLL